MLNPVKKNRMVRKGSFLYTSFNNIMMERYEESKDRKCNLMKSYLNNVPTI